MLKNVVKFNKAYYSMPTEYKEIVQAGVELFYHNRYDTAPANSSLKGKYAQYSQGKYQEKEAIFNKSLKAFANKLAGLGVDSPISDTYASMHPTVKMATFAVISEMIDIVIPETVLEDFYQFSEVKSSNWGDNFVFNVPSSDLFVVSTAAEGTKTGTRQRILGTDVILNPIAHRITAGEDMYRILSGKVNMADFAMRVIRSIETEITTEISTAIFGSYSALATAYKQTGAFSQPTWNTLVDQVTAANAGSKAVGFGTRAALSKIVPADQYFRFGLGEQYNESGYLTNFQGTDLMVLQQRIIPNTDTLAIDNATVLVVSAPSKNLVKIGFEGDTVITQSDVNQNADNSMDYTIFKKWDMKIATSGRYALWTSIS
jgi:hypothetical protein